MVALLLLPLGARGELLELPAELELGEGPIAIELDRARLEITVEEIEVGVLVARTAVAAVGATLEVETGAFGTTIRRPPTPQPSPSLVLELRLAPETPLSLYGVALAVVARAGRSGAPAEPRLGASRAAGAGVDGTAEGSVWRLAVQGSSVDLDGVGSIDLEAFDSQVTLRHGVGTLAVQVSGGATTIGQWGGQVTYAGSPGDLVVDDLSGTLTLTLERGSARLDGGNGDLVVALSGALLRVAAWRGGIEIRGSDSELELTALSTQGKSLTAEGEGLALQLEELDGPAQLRLAGGDLRLTGSSGGLRLAAREHASALLQGVEGALQLELTGGAVARLHAAPRATVRGDVTDASFDVEGAERCQVQGTRARVSLAGVRQLGGVHLTDSELELDLAGVLGDPRLVLLGRSRATVRMEMPCSVRVTGTDPWLDGGRVRVDECDLLSDRQPPRRGLRRRQLTGERELQLNVQMDDEGELEVSAR